VWDHAHLKNGEFPKIFAFTKFNIKKVLGDIAMDPQGNALLDKNGDNSYSDKRKRPINKLGYLVDPKENVID